MSPGWAIIYNLSSSTAFTSIRDNAYASYCVFLFFQNYRKFFSIVGTITDINRLKHAAVVKFDSSVAKLNDLSNFVYCKMGSLQKKLYKF